MLNYLKMKSSDNVKTAYKLIVSRLDERLSVKGFEMISNEHQEEIFGSRFCIWVSEKEKLAIRFIWDGRESWFVLEESPVLNRRSNYSWADIGLFPFDVENFTDEYQMDVSDSILSELALI